MKPGLRDRLITACWLLGCLLWPFASSNAVAQGEPVLSSVNDLVRVDFTGLRLNRTTNTYDTVATLTNISKQTVYGPMRLAIRSISAPGVTLANPSGVTSEGWPFLAVPLPGEGLAPGQKVQNLVLRFANPAKVPFTFQSVLLGQRVLVRAPVASPGAVLAERLTTVQLTVYTFAPQGTSAQVSVHVTKAGAPVGTAVLLRDDGAAPDQSAGDGVFTGLAEFDTAGMTRGQCFGLRAEALVPGSATLSPFSQLCVTEFPIGTAAGSGALIAHPDDATVLVLADQILVTFVPGTTEQDIENVAASVQATVVGTIPRLGIHQFGFSPPLNTEGLAQKLAAVRADSRVAHAEANQQGNLVGDPKAVPNEYASAADLAAAQPGLAIVGAPEAWRVAKSADLPSPVIVAVVDSGVNFTHEDLDGSLAPWICRGTTTAADCQNATANPSANVDAVGHGTFVAGVVGAVNDNTLGIAGASWNARILSVRATDPSGNVNLADAYNAVVKAEALGAKVINISITFPIAANCAALNPVLANALVVAAAGNNGTGTAVYPGSCPPPTTGPGILGVANTQDNDTLNPTSSFGSSAGIAAPGTNVRSTVPPLASCTAYLGFNYCDASGYKTHPGGTSFAAALVSGAAALLRTLDDTLTPSALIAKLKDTAVPLPTPPAANPTLRRLDMCAAVLLANATNPPLRFEAGASLNENATAAALVGRLEPSCDNVTYTLTNDAGGRFALSTSDTAAGREIRVVRGVTALDFEAAASHSITVRAALTRDPTVFAEKTLPVAVTNVNDRPTLNPLANMTLQAGAGLQTVDLLGIGAGAGEGGQVLTVTATSSNLALIPAPAVIYTSPSGTGSLTFTPLPGVTGTATIRVRVTDNGGTVNGGINFIERAFTVTVTAGAGASTLVSCPGNPAGGDQIARGFYVPKFPGSRLDRVELFYSASSAGTYTYRLEARLGSYSGTLLGTAQAVVPLNGSTSEGRSVVFDFGGIAVPPGSIVTFKQSRVAGLFTTTFYAVIPDNPAACPVVQTNSTVAPLDTFRRSGIVVNMFGAP